jgi:acyl-CoA reductase-like NAD-dependent aldehyde dehydrogenase/thiamine pyrophosphate-dependent acetolactate synthase large subunit-like protein
MRSEPAQVLQPPAAAPASPRFVELTGAELIVRLLRAEGVSLAFGVVGGKLAPLLQALSRSKIDFIGVRHEAAGPMMAAAVYAGTGQVAVALGEMGPGGLNMASGAGVAFNNNLAALFITTNQHRAASYPHAGMFMDMDTRAVLAPLTKWNAVVGDARRIPELVRTAFREARGGRPGPVHLDFPHDVLTQRCSWPADEFDVAPARYRVSVGPRPAASLVDEAAQLLRTAHRPLIVAGGGVVASGAAAALRTLAARLQAPAVPTQMALGAVPSDSAHFIGHGGLIAGEAVRRAFDEADTIIAIGCRFSSWMWDEQGPLARRRHRLVNINIDPSALGAPVLHEVGMQADAGLALTDLLQALGEAPPACEPGWLPRLKAVRARYDAKLAVMARDGSVTMHPAALAQAIGRALPRDAIAVFDGGHTTFWSNDLTPVHDVRTRFHEPGMSHLGFGLPYAMALKRVHANKVVVNITGDGAFGFTLQELDSARRHRLPVVNIVHNNAAWGVIRAGQRMQGFEFGTALEDTDYAAIACGFGCYGEVVERAEDVAPALQRALASGLPAVLDCRTKFLPHPAMPAFGSMNRYGFDALTRANASSNEHKENTVNDIRMLIGGERCASASGATFERRNPLDGEVATRAPAATPQDAAQAVDAAAKAFPAWGAMGPGERRSLLLKAAAALEAKTPQFIAAMAAETGAAAPWAGFNVHLAAGMLQEAASITTQINGEVIPSDVSGNLSMALRRPAGVVLGIAPWNAPVILGVRAIATPLACGNTVVLKGSELCPATHGLIVEALHEAGFPAGVVNFVTNAPDDAAAVVEAMVAHPMLRRVNFTGSTRVGRLIAQTCAQYLKPVVLELGGKAPLVVLDDADLEAAVNAATFGAFANSGQICMSTERIVVDEKIADAFVAKLAARAVGLPLGDPRKGPVVLGSVVDASTVERCNALIDDALAQGAMLACGGKADSTLMPATLLDHVTPSMRIYHEESFGPVKPIVRVNGVDEAVHVANDNAYGLSAAVFGRDIARAWQVAGRIESGICHVNGPTVHDEAQMPFGGVKDSGYGRFGGKAGIDAFTELRWVTVQMTDRHYPF